MVKKNKNLLPLLAITGIFLSVSLVSFSQSSDIISTNTQSVLSKSDENKDSGEVSDKIESKQEVKQEEVKIESKEVRNEATKPTTSQLKKQKSNERIRLNTEVQIKRDAESTSEGKPTDKMQGIDSKNKGDDLSETKNDDRFSLEVKATVVGNKTMVESEKGPIEVAEKPEDSINDLVKDGILDNPLSFEAKTNDDNKIEYEVKGTDEKKLFGLFAVSLPKTVTISAETGDIVSSEQNTWTKILSLFSR